MLGGKARIYQNRRGGAGQYVWVDTQRFAVRTLYQLRAARFVAREQEYGTQWWMLTAQGDAVAQEIQQEVSK